VREWRTLPDGTRRANVCEVDSSPEKSGWLSCVAKDGRDTLVPTTAEDDEEPIVVMPIARPSGVKRTKSIGNVIGSVEFDAPSSTPLPALRETMAKESVPETTTVDEVKIYAPETTTAADEAKSSALLETATVDQVKIPVPETTAAAQSKVDEIKYTVRVTLKMRAEADMTSAPAGEMPANTCVYVREWHTLPNGTRRAHVCEVGSSPEKSGWLSCVAKDGRDTLLITTGKRVDNEVEA